MRILLSNDDGVEAPGLAVLEAIARQLSDDVTIVAPAEEQSGKGRSLSLTSSIRLRELGPKRFAVTGTPTDAVMMALGLIMKDNPPDLILSGVNRGANLGEDVSYSGTVSAAMEGALAGIRAIAMSQVYPKEDAGIGVGNNVSFATAEAWGVRAVQPLLDAAWAPRTLVNINFPAVAPDAVQGIRVVPQGLRDYGRTVIDRRVDPRGFDYYWLNLGPVAHTAQEDTDLEVIREGMITVTPLHCDLTHRASMAALERIYS
jgi:5'-nucleotidase